MRQCTRCLLPETHDSIAFDESGVCNICRQAERKTTIDWGSRRRMLDRLVESYAHAGRYDCIVPFSGGKDSVYQLRFVVKELGLKPLVVRFNHQGFRPLVTENNRRVLSQLGVDAVELSPNPQLVRRLMLEGLRANGDFCWHCHQGIFSTALRAALFFGVKLVIFGESPSEYTSYCAPEEVQELDEALFSRLVDTGLKVDEMAAAVSDEFEARELDLFRFPSRESLNDAGIHAIWLGNYVPWDTGKNVEIIKRDLGWKGQSVEGVPPEYDYEKIECRWQGIRDWCKYVKRGYGRTAHLVAIDIRRGRIDQKRGRELISAYDGKVPSSLGRFLDEVGMSEATFYKMLRPHIVKPWQFDLSEHPVGPPLPDMDEWGTLC